MTPGLLALAAMGEEALVADRAGPGVAHLRDPGGEQPPAGDRAQVDVPALAVLAVRGLLTEGGVDLGADLVAADARARADDRLDASLGRELTQGTDALLEHAVGEASPARVDHRDGALGPQRDGQA